MPFVALDTVLGTFSTSPLVTLERMPAVGRTVTATATAGYRVRVVRCPLKLTCPSTLRGDPVDYDYEDAMSLTL